LKAIFYLDTLCHFQILFHKYLTVLLDHINFNITIDYEKKYFKNEQNLEERSYLLLVTFTCIELWLSIYMKNNICFVNLLTWPGSSILIKRVGKLSKKITSVKLWGFKVFFEIPIFIWYFWKYLKPPYLGIIFLQKTNKNIIQDTTGDQVHGSFSSDDINLYPLYIHSSFN